MELNRAIRSGVSAMSGQYRECHAALQARAGTSGCEGNQRTCGLFDSLEDVGAGRKHKAQPLVVESGHCGYFMRSRSRNTEVPRMRSVRTVWTSMMRNKEDGNRWSVLWPACERPAAGGAKYQMQKVGLRSLFSAEIDAQTRARKWRPVKGLGSLRKLVSQGCCCCVLLLGSQSAIAASFMSIAFLCQT